jgi:hypothetical protein
MHLNLARRGVPDFWRTKPTVVQRTNVSLQVDLQIESKIDGAQLYGAVASAWYKTLYHRNASLSQATTAVAAACQAFPNSRRVLYVLQPPSNVSALSAEDHAAIEAEIGTNRWMLEQYGGEVHIAHGEQGIAHSILDDLGLMPRMH